MAHVEPWNKKVSQHQLHSIMDYFHLLVLSLAVLAGIIAGMPRQEPDCTVTPEESSVELLLDTNSFKDYEVEGWIAHELGDTRGPADGVRVLRLL